MEKRSLCLNITQIKSFKLWKQFTRSQSKKVRFYFVTLKWHRSTCYVNWAILTGDLIDVTTLLLDIFQKFSGKTTRQPSVAENSENFKESDNLFDQENVKQMLAMCACCF